MGSYHVSVAAEAYAAALFARAGYHVSVQYGANQPGYDLVVSGDGRPNKISVKGTMKRGWVLTASFKKKGRNYHDAIRAWEKAHKDIKIIYCLVQFRGIAFGDMPRIYLAKIKDMAAYLKASRGGYGYTALREEYQWASGQGAGTIDMIPSEWKMTEARISQLLGPPTT
jgi:hypothetical protein